jgi:hypothetical protein
VASIHVHKVDWLKDDLGSITSEVANHDELRPAWQQHHRAGFMKEWRTHSVLRLVVLSSASSTQVPVCYLAVKAGKADVLHTILKVSM